MPELRFLAARFGIFPRSSQTPFTVFPWQLTRKSGLGGGLQELYRQYW